MYDWDLQVVPGPPKADLKRRVLEEWLRNPFLDDDPAALALRLGVAAPELHGAVASLCDTGFLRAVGSGHVLALDLGGTMPGTDFAGAGSMAPVAPVSEAHPVEPGEAAVQLASLSGAVAVDPVEEADAQAEEPSFDTPQIEDRGDTLSREIEQTLEALIPGAHVDDDDLVEALPFGMVVLRPSGAQELANNRASEMLGVPRIDLDGATFEIATGVNPLAALDRVDPLVFSVTHPRPLEVTLHGRRLKSGVVILVLIRDVGLLEEVSQIQAEVQEELYERLKGDMVDPLVMIETFLEHPDANGLVQARVAMEQINWFLQEFFLRERGRGSDRNRGEHGG